MSYDKTLTDKPSPSSHPDVRTIAQNAGLHGRKLNLVSMIKELICSTLPKRSWVKITQIRTISTERIENYIGLIDFNQMNEIMLAIDDLIKRD